jgi:pimeloyl-ACP methyl ester carboxylesterase
MSSATGQQVGMFSTKREPSSTGVRELSRDAPMTLLLLALVSQVGVEIPAGAGKVAVELRGQAIDLFTYRPAAFHDGPMLIVFHGVLRNADEYRDDAEGLADRLEMLVVAPRFDRTRFPSDKYNRGGMLSNGKLAPRDTWTWTLIPELIEKVRQLERRPDMPVYLIGHSAGAQFTERLAAFVPVDARRIVVANAGVHLFPNRDLPFSFGFGTIPEEVSNDAALKAFLARPITIYLGTGDVLRDDDLYTGEPADEQGRNRLERGRNMYHAAEALARERDWPFSWRLVEAPGVGHDHRAMFDNPMCKQALFGVDEPASKTPQQAAPAKGADSARSLSTSTREQL